MTTDTGASQTPKRPVRQDVRQADFTVKQQLLGKLGPRGYGRLLEKLRRAAQ